MQTVIQRAMVLKWFFQKITKIAQRLRASLPAPHSLWRLGTPTSDPRRYADLRNTSLNLKIFHFFTFGSSPLPLEKARLCAKPGHGF